MNAVVHLAPHEFASDHPCTDPDLYEADEQLLAYMLQDLRALVRRRRNGEVELAPYEVLAWSVHDLARRQVICDPAGLEEKRDVCIVGFFGERRGNPETQPRIDRLESALHEEFRDVLWNTTSEKDVEALYGFGSAWASGVRPPVGSCCR